MAVTATLSLAKTRLLWPQSTVVRATLVNDTDAPLEDVNREHYRAEPAVGVTAIETREGRWFSQSLPPGADPPSLTLAPGETLDVSFDLARRATIPGPGAYEVRVRFAWEGGKVETPPALVEVLPGAPETWSLSTRTGTQIGDALCAWVHHAREAPALWLTTIETTMSGALGESVVLAALPDVVFPVLSVPPATVPSRVWVGWTFEGELRYVTYANGARGGGAVALDRDDWQLIPPLLEDPPSERAPSAEALLVSVDPDAYWLRVARLEEGAAPEEPVRVEGAGPVWARTAYRSDGSRATVLLHPGALYDGRPVVSAAVSRWKRGAAPGAPVSLATWMGALSAADLLLRHDDRVVGAALLDQGAGRYVLQRWSIDREGRYAEDPPRALAWPPEVAIDDAMLRVDAFGEPHVLLRTMSDGRWFWCSPAGFSSLETASEDARPVDIVFVGQTTPAVLQAVPGRGLSIVPTASVRRGAPPNGVG